MKGINTEPHHLIEIEDIEEQISNLIEQRGHLK
jgi:hypothetical protein